MKLVLPTDPGEKSQWLRILHDDLQLKGYILGQDADGAHKLLSRRGQFSATTEGGIIYTLYFGDVVSGEITNDTQNSKNNPQTTNKDTEERHQPQERHQAEGGRYVMVVVAFDEAILGPQPEKPQTPVMPEKPDGYDEWKTIQLAKTETEDNKKEPDQQNADSGDSDIPEPPESISQEADEIEARFNKYEQELKQHEDDLNSLETRTSEYEARLQEWNQKKATGMRKVKELRERLGQWYYVIDNAVFEELQFDRNSIINRPPPALPLRPSISMPNSE